MSSIYTGLLTIVAATVVTSGMIIMTGESNADSKFNDLSKDGLNINQATNQENKPTAITLDEDKENGNKKSAIGAVPPPPPGPYIYGSTFDSFNKMQTEPSVVRSVGNSGKNSPTKKPLAPAIPMGSVQPNAPMKPSMLPPVQSSQLSVKPSSGSTTSNQKTPKVPENNRDSQQADRNVGVKTIKAPKLQKIAPIFSQKELEPPKQVIKNIKSPEIKRATGSFKPERRNINIGSNPALPIPVAPSIDNLSAPKLKVMQESSVKPNIAVPELPKLRMTKPVMPTAPVTSVTVKSLQPKLTKPTPNTPSAIALPNAQPSVLQQQTPVQQKQTPVQRQQTPVQQQQPPVLDKTLSIKQQVPNPSALKPSTPQFSQPMPQNLVPSFKMPDSTIPSFYYYYPAPNWNNNNQMPPYYGYQFAPNENVGNNSRVDQAPINNGLGKQFKGQYVPPAIMQKNINSYGNNPGAGGQN